MAVERALNPTPAEVRMIEHPSPEHTCLADFLKGKKAQVINDVRPVCIETPGRFDKALGLIKAELAST
jgi:hypothetical protein